MIRGNTAVWASFFVSIDNRFLERLAELWPSIVAKFSSRPNEDAITRELVRIVSKDNVVQSLFYPEYQYEPFDYAADGTSCSKGKIDFAGIVFWDRDIYLAYECKCLNVIRSGNRRSLASEYVHDGVMRYVTEKYAQNLPVGCMLGYVMDGDIEYATRSVKTAIKGAEGAALRSGPTDLDPIGSVSRIKTDHDRSESGPIEIRHAFLPFRIDIVEGVDE